MTDDQATIPETTPEPTTPLGNDTTPEPKAAKNADLFAAPADVDADAATGYAVFDRVIGQYVGGVTKGKPSAADAKAAVTKGHAHKIVRV